MTQQDKEDKRSRVLQITLNTENIKKDKEKLNFRDSEGFKCVTFDCFP